ncbi:MAG: excinuclease ABC subunit A, excinuclease ABC subunit A [Candidatus Peregrinibacteria bacterium GW2011_GWF2_33_10]|nr:MAG: excinuclease ABC subunit A, excinuclease ABC subunit A [Candidatus Peregrinibacteria bacterium GW2011_GWF2_33_10]OGJ44509.1 MAG: excinuclease ABC subunit A [Candidatus Peregrinibacteria bacterium RIFOXYA2_FULL_33_21]OGJ46745.1 MAG: excinuclease ABC subunit A [Candidatus Peregrinibacteria bacterium RIFOXYA12_FULL_33_12]OGJ50317.1 MAG: excinuclease ABC subunit A [Candidatus Peregrinibacteria bacterium RIFOXYB2_FULL_33_20]
MKNDKIIVKGAKIHNLKNIDVEIPRDKLIVFTGLSGSGKSSLAFDTIYAEGQRRYVESLSTYARQFLQTTEKPEVDQISGLSPAISIDQKTTSHNPRSTVGTVTEIYDYLRLLYAKIGHPHCPYCGTALSRQTISQIVEIIANLETDKKIILLAPIIRDKKGAYQKVFERVKKDGFVRVRVDGEVYSVLELPELDEKKKHSIEVVVDRLVIKDLKINKKVLSSGQEIEISNPNRTRLADSVETTVRYGNGIIIIQDHNSKKDMIFSEHFTCPNHSEVNIPEIEPRNFSFNSPHGACDDCHGLGTKLEVDRDLIIQNQNLTLAEGAITPWSGSVSHLTWYNNLLNEVAKIYKFSMNVPVKKLSDEVLNIILQGTGDKKYKVSLNKDAASASFEGEYTTTFEGVIPNLERRYRETESDYLRKKIESYMQISKCLTCDGKRLKKAMLSVKIHNKSIIDVTEFSIKSAIDFFKNLKLLGNEGLIAKQILKEVIDRLNFLQDVGLSYLTLNRSANTLSGGEAQRIRLATQIGSQLQGVLYVLDEPSIGLHQNDTAKLIKTLIHLRDIGNTVIVVEHDVETMMSADYILDVGPGAGKLGGEVVAAGTPQELMANKNSITGQYLSGAVKIDIPKVRRKGNGKFLEIIEANENNLKNVNVKIPLGCFVGITGVSGSGKSSLINDILVKSLARSLNNAKSVPGKHKEILGVEHLDKIINIDQSPIGRTPRSNPATYTGVFTDIRELFASLPESKLRGYTPSRFSFNVKGGRCEDCEGDGIKKIEMHFLPDIYVPCETCHGKRYNREALEIIYRGKNIADVLDMTVDEALEFFTAIPSIKSKLTTLSEVGLGYIHLGQPATTLSGGEAQRIKLATELSKRSTGRTFYVLDEPTTGLHFDDVKKLLEVLERLVESGNTVLTIEHNLDVIKTVDYVIDLGPEGGDNGGEVIVTGTPENVAKCKTSLTGKWLGKIIDFKL